MVLARYVLKAHKTNGETLLFKLLSAADVL
jgi:hypothetical protein